MTLVLNIANQILQAALAGDCCVNLVTPPTHTDFVLSSCHILQELRFSF